MPKPNQTKRLWDDYIPDTIILPGRTPGRREPEGHDLVLQRLPGAKYAAYYVDYGRDRFIPPRNGSVPKVIKG